MAGQAKPSWDDIARSREDKDLPEDHITKVLDRIGQTEDGRKLTKWIHDAFVFSAAPTGATESALRDIAANQRIGLRLYKHLEPTLADRNRDRE